MRRVLLTGLLAGCLTLAFGLAPGFGQTADSPPPVKPPADGASNYLIPVPPDLTKRLQSAEVRRHQQEAAEAEAAGPPPPPPAPPRPPPPPPPGRGRAPPRRSAAGPAAARAKPRRHSAGMVAGGQFGGSLRP